MSLSDIVATLLPIHTGNWALYNSCGLVSGTTECESGESHVPNSSRDPMAKNSSHRTTLPPTANMTAKPVLCLVLDASPLITQLASAIQQYAEVFYTTPGVRSELRDEHSRNQLLLWGDSLQVRQPKPEYIEKVSAFARITGDYSVLSMNDVHVIALAYELECESTGGAHLRAFPGENKGGVEKKEKESTGEKPVQNEPEEELFEDEGPQVDEDGFQIVQKKKTKLKKQEKKERREAWEKKEAERQEQEEAEKREAEKRAAEERAHSRETEHISSSAPSDADAALSEEFNDDDDDGDWITPENIEEEKLRDNNEHIVENSDNPSIPVALSTGDFACQNVTLQIGLNLMNSISGRQIRRVRNYMLRCHACFSLTPLPKSGAPKHFCSRCGGNTLLRCAVSVNHTTGKVTPHLKQNFQWIRRGDKFSLPSPQSKNQQRIIGNGGYQHNKDNRHKALHNPLILREDQKEYQQAIKDNEWQRRKNEKLMQEWIDGGSADNFVSPFTATEQRHLGVRVGRGRHANASRKRR